MALSNPHQPLLFDAPMRIVDADTYKPAKREFDPVAAEIRAFPEQPTVARIRNVFPVDGGTFPAILSDAERAQITAGWWIADYRDRCRRHLLITMKAAQRREPTDAEYALLETMIAEARAAGELPYETMMVMLVFMALKEKAHG